MATPLPHFQEERHLCITQRCKQEDPSVAERVLANKADVSDAQFFISDHRTAGDYILLQNNVLDANFAIASVTDGLFVASPSSK